MYKVFINDRLIFFVHKSEKNAFSSLSNTYEFSTLEDLTELIDKWINNTQNKNSEVVYCENVDLVFELFKQQFKLVEAAGGIVNSETGKQLWIFRLGKWDLPKGKIEKGEQISEAALREVTEECDLHDITLKAQLETTYHTYIHKDKRVLKPTYWFAMEVAGEPKLKPQVEEGITDVVWLTPEEVETQALKNTYASIQELIFSTRN